MGGREEVPGAGEWTREGITGWGVGVTGGEGGKGGKVGEGSSGLSDVGSLGTGGDDVTCPTTVRAQAGVRPATAFLKGKRAAGSPGAIK